MKTVLTSLSIAVISLLNSSPSIATITTTSQDSNSLQSIQAEAKTIEMAQFDGILKTIKKGQDVIERQRRLEDSQRRREESRRRREEAEQRRQERIESRRKRQEDYDAAREGATKQQGPASQPLEPTLLKSEPQQQEPSRRSPDHLTTTGEQLTRTGYYKNLPPHKSGLLQKKWPDPKDDQQVLAQKFLRAVEKNEWKTINALHCSREGDIRKGLDSAGGRYSDRLKKYLLVGYALYDIDFARVTYETGESDVRQGVRRGVVVVGGPVLLHQNGGKYTKFNYRQVIRTQIPNYLRMIVEDGRWKLCNN